MRKKCIAFIMSDFKGMHQHEELEQLIKQTGRRHDVVALQIDDPVNQTLPSLGWMRIQDPETGLYRLCNTSSKRAKSAWKASYLKHQDELTKLMKRTGVDFTVIPTNGSLPTLMKLFHDDRIEITQVKWMLALGTIFCALASDAQVSWSVDNTEIRGEKGSY